MTNQQQQQEEVFGTSSPDRFSLDTTVEFPQLLSEESLSMLKEGHFTDFSRLADQLQAYQERVTATMQDLENSSLQRVERISLSSPSNRPLGLEDDYMVTDDHTAA